MWEQNITCQTHVYGELLMLFFIVSVIFSSSHEFDHLFSWFMKENHLPIIFQINIFQNKVNNKGIKDISEYNTISHRNTERTTS